MRPPMSPRGLIGSIRGPIGVLLVADPWHTAKRREALLLPSRGDVLPGLARRTTYGVPSRVGVCDYGVLMSSPPRWRSSRSS